MKVLIGYDGSPCADEALQDLQRAGLPREVEVLVLSVADLLPLPQGDTMAPPPLGLSSTIEEARATSSAMIERAKTHAVNACERLRTAFPNWQVSAKGVGNSPAWAIILEAEAWHADLIVLGSHGYSPLERWMLGSVSQTVLTQAPCSVRIARGRPTESNRPLRILVGVDGSTDAEHAVRAVAGRIWPAGTDIRLMMVLDPSIVSAVNGIADVTEEQRPVPADEKVDGRIRQLFDGYKAIAQQNASDVRISTALMTGDPKHVLVEEAERWGADCIFIGSRGLTGWELLLLGSVSTAVAARARCPVEVVRVARPSS